MENNLVVLPKEVAQIAENVSVEKRNEVQSVLNHVFNGVSKMREQLDNVTVTDENDKVNMKLANTIRLGVRQVRLEAEKTFDAKRAEVQQQMLSYKTEDSLWLKAKQTMQILTKEIEENARWKEETAKRFEEEQKELKIQTREMRLGKYMFAPDINRKDFENMNDETFEIFFAGIEKAYNDKIEAERKAEEERIAKEKAEAEARELQRLENERLKAEAEKREKEIEAERKANELKLAEERAKAKAEADRIEAKNKALLKAEQEKKEKLEAELKAKLEAEQKAENERKQAEAKAKLEAEKLQKAPLKKQLTVWVESFTIAEINIENEKKTLIKEKFEAFKKWAKNEIENI